MHYACSPGHLTPHSYLSKKYNLGNPSSILHLASPKSPISFKQSRTKRYLSPNAAELQLSNFKPQSLSQRGLPLVVTNRINDYSNVATNYLKEDSSGFLSIRDDVESSRHRESPVIHKNKLLKSQSTLKLRPLGVSCDSARDHRSHVRSTSTIEPRNKNSLNLLPKGVTETPKDYIKVVSQITPGESEKSLSPKFSCLIISGFSPHNQKRNEEASPRRPRNFDSDRGVVKVLDLLGKWQKESTIETQTLHTKVDEDLDHNKNENADNKVSTKKAAAPTSQDEMDMKTAISESRSCVHKELFTEAIRSERPTLTERDEEDIFDIECRTRFQRKENDQRSNPMRNSYKSRKREGSDRIKTESSQVLLDDSPTDDYRVNQVADQKRKTINIIPKNRRLQPSFTENESAYIKELLKSKRVSKTKNYPKDLVNAIQITNLEREPMTLPKSNKRNNEFSPKESIRSPNEKQNMTSPLSPISKKVFLNPLQVKTGVHLVKVKS